MFRGTTSGGESSTPINVNPLSSTTTTFEDTNLPAGSYFYMVKAVDGQEVSVPSNEVEVTVPSPTTSAPTVSSAATSWESQTTSGLVITPSTVSANYFYITNITGGSLFQSDGVTPITDDEFISVTQGEFGLKFTPAASSTGGSFTVQQATGQSTADLIGTTAVGTISVSGSVTPGLGTISPVLNLPYNQEGITTDGTRPSNGGIDGAGNTVSYNALTTSTFQTSTNGLAVAPGTGEFATGGFVFGDPNSDNVVASIGQTVSMTSTQQATTFSQLQMLAFGVNGNQAASVTINYTDGTSTTIPLSFSDWFKPQGYANESVAVAMGHRNTANGGTDNRTFNIYAYTLPIDTSKHVASITLPNSFPDFNVKVLALDLIQ